MTRRYRAAFVGTALLIAGLMLVGCVGAAAPPASGVPSTSDSPGPEDSSMPTPLPTPSLGPSLPAAGEVPICDGVVRPWGECTSSTRFVWLHDEGPIRYAMGTVDLDQYGDPLAYHVVSGDVFSVISARFGDGAGATLWSLNCYRRSDTTVFIGDVINLSPYTVETVGSENGRTTSMSAATAEGCLAQSALPPQD